MSKIRIVSGELLVFPIAGWDKMLLTKLANDLGNFFGSILLY